MAINSPLDEIAGIGSRRKQALLRHFGSARAVARAGLAEIERVGGISKTVAKRFMTTSTAMAKMAAASRPGHPFPEKRVPLTSLPTR
jgi:ERCC4-type nuclease